MNSSKIIAIAVALLAWASIGKAEILSAPCADDGDQAIICTATWDLPNLTMNIVGNQYWGPGHIGTLPLSERAAFLTDGLDPTVKMHNTIDNDTGLTWTGYHINVYMDKAFTLSEPLIYKPDTSEEGWTGVITVSPAVDIGGGVWKGQVDYSAGTPIPNGGVIDFSYKMTFVGTVHYCQEMIPVPEPGAIILVLSGLLGLVVVRVARRVRG
jgi:hypothetical protein